MSCWFLRYIYIYIYILYPTALGISKFEITASKFEIRSSNRNLTLDLAARGRVQEERVARAAGRQQVLGLSMTGQRSIV